MKKILFLLLLSLFLSGQSIAQQMSQSEVDSMIAELPNIPDDSSKVFTLIMISDYYTNINPVEGINYGQQALDISTHLNYASGISYSNKYIGLNYLELSDFPNALKYLMKSLKIAEENGDSLMVQTAKAGLGSVYFRMSDWQKSLEYNQAVLKYFLKSDDKYNIGTEYINIGAIYCDGLHDYTTALDYFTKALKVFQEISATSIINVIYNNLGVAHMNLKEYTKALNYFELALQINSQSGNLSSKAMNHVNIGETYLTIAKNIHSDSVHAQSNQLFPGMSSNNILSTSLHLAKSHTDSAINIYRQTGSLKDLYNSYLQQSSIDSCLGDYKSAFDNYRLYASLKDTVFNLEKDKKITQIGMQYNFEKKEATIRAEQEKKFIRQRNIRNSFIGGVVLMLLLLLLLYNRYRIKQKANSELATAYDNLKSTQQQLVQSEKMAAFGVMASRISHEIQNPLNFVNNFSELSEDLIQEIVNSDNEDEKRNALTLLKENIEKIKLHGKRTDAIIKQLQEHSNKGTAQEYFETDDNKSEGDT
ncbi:MAG: tetratricopeptide repeat protein [Bacteroidetes bacterium]|nr:tetratricopeptide repeat protein [Bacteroidota bacterium]